MRTSLRPFARSACLRVLGMFAWLMLATAASHASSSPSASVATPAMAGMDHHGMRDMAPAGPAPASAHAGPDCCRGAAAPHCDCPAMCGFVLAPVGMLFLPLAPPSARYRKLPILAAPMPSLAPPLRPPLV